MTDEMKKLVRETELTADLLEVAIKALVDGGVPREEAMTMVAESAKRQLATPVDELRTQLEAKRLELARK